MSDKIDDFFDNLSKIDDSLSKKTIEEWSEEYEIEILDPDGFDRSDPDLMNKKFTKKEFKEGLILSTICIKEEKVQIDEFFEEGD